MRRQDKKISYWINADLCTYLSLWDHLERGAEMKSRVIWQSKKSWQDWYQILTKNGGIHKKRSKLHHIPTLSIIFLSTFYLEDILYIFGKIINFKIGWFCTRAENRTFGSLYQSAFSCLCIENVCLLLWSFWQSSFRSKFMFPKSGLRWMDNIFYEGLSLVFFPPCFSNVS